MDYQNISPGQRFGKWTVLDAEPTGRFPSTLGWLCRCDCGREKRVRARHLASGASTQCRSCQVASKNERHGGSERPEYSVLKGMIARCHNPNDPSFDRYGGAGVYVCDEWRDSFSAFLEHIGPRPSADHTIDRVDNEQGYEPGNVRWATLAEQSRNRRYCWHITIDGETRTASEWARESGVSGSTIKRRIAAGWWPREAVYTPASRDRDSYGRYCAPR